MLNSSYYSHSFTLPVSVDRSQFPSLVDMSASASSSVRKLSKVTIQGEVDSTEIP